MFEYVLDDAGGLAQLLLVDDERGCEADDVPVGGLGDEALFGHCQADVPGLETLLRLGDDGRTDLKKGELIPAISSRKILPSLSAFSVRCSSRMTSRAATATLAARGKPPKVEPCSPGLMVSMISSSAKTAEIGSTPPERALPMVIMSGRMPSWSQANMRPVRPIPVWTSSAIASCRGRSTPSDSRRGARRLRPRPG